MAPERGHAEARPRGERTEVRSPCNPGSDRIRHVHDWLPGRSPSQPERSKASPVRDVGCWLCLGPCLTAAAASSSARRPPAELSNDFVSPPAPCPSRRAPASSEQSELSGANKGKPCGLLVCRLLVC
jgi:hypothetical protein